jgi:hypothetical protein
MTAKSALNATEKVLLIRALRTKGAARRATVLALSPMTDKGPRRFGIRNRLPRERLIAQRRD